jgi:hypothetical protein
VVDQVMRLWYVKRKTRSGVRCSGLKIKIIMKYLLAVISMGVIGYSR